MNDLSKMISRGKIRMFADDIRFYYSFLPSEVIHATGVINTELANISLWTDKNALLLNPSKCSTTIFGSKSIIKRLNGSPDIVVNNIALRVEKNVKNLGIIFDETLKFHTHINLICQRTYAAFKALSPLREILDVPTKKLLCESLVLSHANYGACVYGPCISEEEKFRLQKIQNSCIRFIFPVPRHSHVTPFLRQLSWLNMNERRFLFYCSLVNSICLTNKPDYLSSLITWRHSVHSVHTRHASSTAEIPKYNLNSFKASFSYLAAYIINNVFGTSLRMGNKSRKRLLKKEIFSGMPSEVDLKLF